MRKWTGRKTAAAVIAGAFLSAAGAAQAAQIITGPCQATADDPSVHAAAGCTVEPGASGIMQASLATEGDMVAALQNDIVFSTNVTVVQEFDAMTTTTADISAVDTAIPVVDASAFPDLGIILIGDEQIAYASKTGNTLNVAGGNNEDPPSFVCNPAGAQPPDCNPAADPPDCPSGQMCVPSGRGQNGTTAVAHASGSAVGLPAEIPDCKMTAALAALHKSAVFSFLPGVTTENPAGCTPGTDCTGIRAIVVSIDEHVADLIPDGTVLYTCKLNVSAGGPSGNAGDGAQTLECPSDPDNPPPAPFLNAKSTTPPPPLPNDTTCQANQVRLCIGDCNLDRQVFGNEVSIAIQIVAGNQPIENCLAADGNNDGTVFGNEVSQAIFRLANNCTGTE